MTRIRIRAGDERGSALISATIIIAVLLLLGVASLSVTTTDFQIAGADRDMAQARAIAEAGLQQVVAMQNDSSLAPRYLFDPASYLPPGVDPVLADFAVSDPQTGAAIGTASRRMLGGKDPLVNPPPYRVRSTATVHRAVTTLEAEVAPRSLLEYALWTEASVGIAAGITYGGKVYSATSITLQGYPITFERKVEYVTVLNNPANGIFNDDVVDLAAAKPSLTALVDIPFFENAAKNPGVCDEGWGLYIGTDAGEPPNQSNNLFKRVAGVYQIDLTLFDFSGPFESPPQPIRYNGTALKRFGDSQPLVDFNGIIFVDGHLHIWGINGGRSPEDIPVRDDISGNPVATRYNGPTPGGINNVVGQNLYSNNRLDPGEDLPPYDGVLDPARRGRSLTIVTATAKDIFPDHNIFMGFDSQGRPVRTALISGRAIHVDANAPKTTMIEAALLAMGSSTCAGGAGGGSWDPCTNAAPNGHPDNWWAKSGATYIWDLDYDGVLENPNQALNASDRNENSMLGAWSLRVLGNRVFVGVPNSGIWASPLQHIRNYDYDETLLIYEPPCYPVLPTYGLVAGSVTEIR